MYRIVASDMDETFLAHDGSLPPANVEAVRRLRELGCLFVPASGRPYPSILQSIASIPTELMEDSYVISYNGGCINRYGEDEPLATTEMDFDKVDALYKYSMTLGLGVHVYELSGRVWVTRLVQEEWDYVGDRMEMLPFEADDLSFLRDKPLAKILYVKPDGLAYLHEVAEAMPAELLEGVDVTFSSGRYVEFVPAGVNKGAGLTRLAGIVGADLSETIACGDAENDLPMLEVAGIGVAVANASGDLPDRADYTTRTSCADGMLAEVVRELVEPANRPRER